MLDALQTPAGTSLLSVVVAVVTSGLVIGLLKLGPDRRKIGADANLANANAASVLTGSALDMVRSAEQRAARAERSAARAWRRVHVLEQAMRDAGVAVPPADELEHDDEHADEH